MSRNKGFSYFKSMSYTVSRIIINKIYCVRFVPFFLIVLSDLRNDKKFKLIFIFYHV